jgi:hypothetical protein
VGVKDTRQKAYGHLGGPASIAALRLLGGEQPRPKGWMCVRFILGAMAMAGGATPSYLPALSADRQALAGG